MTKLSLSMLLCLAACGLVPLEPPSDLERAASELTLAWVAYDNAQDDAAKEAARQAMAVVLAKVAGMNLDLTDVVPSPGIIVLVGQLMPEASQDEVDLYSRVLTVILRSG